jgi:hypothetical protein
VDTFCSELEDEDQRLSLSLSSISNIYDRLQQSYTIQGAIVASQIILVYLLSISKMASENESVKFVFSQDLNRIAPEEREITSALTSLSRTNMDAIPENLRTPELQDMLNRAQEARRIQEERHKMLSNQTSEMSEDELKKLKELQIAKHPFPHTYILERGTYPGAGFISMPGMEPFRISIAPQKTDDIPSELLRETTLHTTGTPQGKRALGWVGGYADYDNKILYIAEVQSDTMQRTVQMRDPRKVKRERKRRNIEDIRKLKERVKNLETQLSTSPESPVQKLQLIINKIDAENSTLDPNSGRWIANNNRKQQVLQQISNISAKGMLSPKTDLISQQLEEAKKQLQTKMEQGLNFGTQPRTFTGSFVKEWPQWHDYKSRVENRFKDWIPIFFNTAMREAKRRGFESVRIVDSDTLMKVWASWATQETLILFKRVYDDIAQRYGGTMINVTLPSKAGGTMNTKWYHIPITAETRIAKMHTNWLQKLSQQNMWLTVNPENGRAVWQSHLDTFFDTMKSNLVDATYDAYQQSTQETQESYDLGIS